MSVVHSVARLRIYSMHKARDDDRKIAEQSAVQTELSSGRSAASRRYKPGVFDGAQQPLREINDGPEEMQVFVRRQASWRGDTLQPRHCRQHVTRGEQARSTHTQWSAARAHEP
jgi:hypothetical protein